MKLRRSRHLPRRRSRHLTRRRPAAPRELGLGCITSSSRAFVTLLPNWIGRTQTVALSARVTTLGAVAGYKQGGLAGDRQNLQVRLRAFTLLPSGISTAR